MKINNSYRPVPFWSWNDRLNTEETRRQINLMKDAGIGGYFIHARGGLKSVFMGDEWMDNFSVAVDEGKKSELSAWAYDENGWPSGVADGAVTAKGVPYQQKFLLIEKGEKHTETTICNINGYHLYYEVNRHYCDTLNIESVKLFINEIYEKYYEKYKNSIKGFFTDEPQITRNHIPWSFCLPSEYEKRYGEDLIPHLAELFSETGDFKKTRFRFWKLVTDLFSSSFMKPIYDWCDKRGLLLTGHLILEENLEYQLTTNGAIMPHYEYFHIPGVDCLGKRLIDPLTPLQLSSVGHQLGKKQLLTETYAGSTHNLTHDFMKAMFESQAVRGANFLCQHLEGYTLRGIRKRDYPPAMFYQQPWWKDYKVFNDYVAAVGSFLGEGEVKYDTLLIHPQSTAWIYFDNGENKGLKELNDSFIEIINKLEKKNILFHLGDETIMERHARVDGNTLVIGRQKYKKIILPPYEILFENTKKLLSEFAANGGEIVTEDKVEKNDIVDNSNIHYTIRYYGEKKIYYFVNLSDKTVHCNLSCCGYIHDIMTGERKSFCKEYDFAPYESIFIEESCDAPNTEQTGSNKPVKSISLKGNWKIEESTPNILTLDFCKLLFDGNLIGEKEYVPDIQLKACNLGRKVRVKCIYKVSARFIPQKIYLVVENPEQYIIKLNDVEITKNDCGYFMDSSFRMINIAPFFLAGNNVISLETDFVQSDEVYENVAKSIEYEGIKNKLTYDMEIEPIYIVGDFFVGIDSKFEIIDDETTLYNGAFTIDKSKTSIKTEDIEKQGFPFFAGNLTISKTFNLEDTDYSFDFKKCGINVVSVSVNNSPFKKILWEPHMLDLRSLLKKGENKITLRLTDNLNNMLGPHHCTKYCKWGASPAVFFKEKCIWNCKISEEYWCDGYIFKKRSIENR